MIFSTYRHRFGKTVWLGFIPIRTAQRNTTKQRHQWEYTASAIRYTWITMKEIFFLGFFDGFFFLCLVVSVCCYFFSSLSTFFSYDFYSFEFDNSPLFCNGAVIAEVILQNEQFADVIADCFSQHVFILFRYKKNLIHFSIRFELWQIMRILTVLIEVQL